MDGIFQAFPADDFAPLWGILLLPLIGAVVNGVFGKRLGRNAVTLMALVAVGVSFLMSVFAFFALLAHGRGHGTTHEAARLSVKGWEWLSLSLAKDSGSLGLDIAFSLDALSGVMALVVTGVGLIIHLYSTKYMQDEPGYYRYFAYMNLFVFAMLVLVLGDNLPVLFVGWEGAGICSYLLIGFWFDEEKNARAAKKAFVADRTGDFGLLVAMGLLVVYCGRLDFDGIASGTTLLLTPIELTQGFALPVQAVFEGVGLRYVSAATLVGLCLFLGCIAKSSQLPLYVWLPEAMVGPTPASALIHAATMVTAGVYLVCRMAPVFVMSPFVMFVIALFGALTALFAAVVALTQRDIKKILAYSTISQLGLMFVGVGVGAFTAGVFHVVTHAFFKSCLFLGAGSVVQAMRARVAEREASQDIRYMGGFAKFLPVTCLTFIASWAAIVGVPFSSGFFSNNEILYRALTSSITVSTQARRMLQASGDAIEMTAWPAWGNVALFTLGCLAVTLTAFYMTRLVYGVFFGKFRGWRVVEGYQEALGAEDSTRKLPVQPGPVAGLSIEGPKPQESSWVMTLPLVVLGVFALGTGFFDATLFKLVPLEHLLYPVFRNVPNVLVQRDVASLRFVVSGVGVAACCLGVGAAYVVYVVRRGTPADTFVRRFPKLYRLAVDTWRVDELYRNGVVGVLELVSFLGVWLDKWVVDGILVRVTTFVISALGASLRLLQSGRVQTYACLLVLGVAAIGWHFATPHARVTIQGDARSGRYVISASEGLSYGYRWDENGDGKYDSQKFGTRSRIEIELKRAESRKVSLQVINVLGRVYEETFNIERPREDLSRGMTRIDVFDDENGGKRAVVKPPRTPEPSSDSPTLNERAPDSEGNAPAPGSEP